MKKRDELEQTMASRQTIITKLIGRNKEDKKKIAVIDAKKEPEKVYSVGDRYKDADGTKFILARIKAPDVSLVQLDNGDLRGSPSKVAHNSKITRREFDKLCCGLELTRYYDARKQAEVGEKSEQGKSESKAKDKPKLRHLDYYHDGCNMVLIAKKDDMWLMHYPEWAGTVGQGEQGMIDRIGSCGYIRQGNLADDLTETSEGFEMENGGGYGPLEAETGNTMDNGVRIHHGNHCIVIGGSVLAEFHRKLGHVLNGLRSKK